MNGAGKGISWLTFAALHVWKVVAVEVRGNGGDGHSVAAARRGPRCPGRGVEEVVEAPAHELQARARHVAADAAVELPNAQRSAPVAVHFLLRGGEKGKGGSFIN